MRLPMQRLIEKTGAKAIVVPALKEVPLSENPKAFEFFEKLEAGQIDYFILLTGVALRTLISVLETRFPKDRIVSVLSTKTKIVVRGPKPKSVCAMNGIPVAVTVPEPNTWREILDTLQAHSLSGKKITVLEYGVSNTDFIDDLIRQGATVETLPVYQWALPDDVAPMEQLTDQIIAGQVDILLFTTQIQTDHLLQVVRRRNLELSFRRALQKVVIGSIGPVTSERLREHQFFPDFEASPNKLDDLVKITAEVGQDWVKKKRARVEKSWIKIESQKSKVKSLECASILKACRRESNSQIPVWLMRQAGRYMAEYHLSRRGLEFLDFCKRPELAAEATLYAVERLGVDAAIIFADILLIVEPLGLSLTYAKGEGPQMGPPVRSLAAVEALKPVNVQESLGYVMEAVRQVRSQMDSRIPLIGFCGAPFTVASYMIEGRSSKNFIPTKLLMHQDPKAWHLLLEKITTASIDYLNAQVEAGADLLQIFDSWVGQLSAAEYREFVMPHSKRLIAGVQDSQKHIPIIHFGTNTDHLLELMKEAGGDVIGVDTKTDIVSASSRLSNVAIQGNLDPVLLFADRKTLLAEAKKILEAVGSRPGFIFNLGHGILPETPVDNVMALVDYVHEWVPKDK